MMTSLTTMISVVALVAGLSGQHGKTDAAGLTGTWNMGLQGGHVIPVALVLEQNGEALTGTVSMPTQRIGQTVDVALKGEFAHGSFTLAGAIEGSKEPVTIEIRGKLNDEGMLEGTVTMGGRGEGHRDMPYTAERLKERSQ
ncbi:MAG TPA: hypothetical protein VHT95_09695 [Vicinamibacterales bacterium]|nr:hypothetical protein [Vicinamibacterales bacterium]